MGDLSTELCAGTHVTRTGDIGVFRIVSEGGVASGVRRIEALTGAAALEYIGEIEKNLATIAGMLKSDRDSAADKLRQLQERSRALEKELEQVRARLASGQGSDLAATATDVAGVKVVAARVDGADPKALREAVDGLKNKLQSAAVVLASVENGKVRLVAGVTRDQTKHVKAGDLVNMVARQVGGRGGGRPDMAQAGGSDADALEGALESVPEWVRSKLA
jgi:alanyl-tRNA synthetase